MSNLMMYRRAVRGGRRPKESFKFRNERSTYTPDWIAVQRRVDDAWLGTLEKELGRFLAYPPSRRSPIGSYATRIDAAIALEGAYELKDHRKRVREHAKVEAQRAERTRLYRDRTSEARGARTVAGP